MGLILAAIAVNHILSGIKAFFIEVIPTVT
jgi:multiple antibiotic resistance protein